MARAHSSDDPRRLPADRAWADLETGGEPLPAALRRDLEPRFGHDFSTVRVHRDADAASSARALGAHAYTVGEHITFGSGRFAPDQPAGRALIAHELTHVLHQRHATAEPAAADRASTVDDPHERHADVVAGRVLGAGGPVSATELASVGRLSHAIQRNTPAAASVTDPRPPVLKSEEKQLAKLLAFLEQADKKIAVLSSNTPPVGEEWVLFINDHVLALLRLLSQLLNDLRANRLVVRFDMPVGDPTKAASYEPTADLIHLQPFGSDAELHTVTARLVHEYAHVLQDRQVEELMATTLKPVEHSRAAELGQEIEAHRHEAYFVRMLGLVGLLSPAERLDMGNLAQVAMVDEFEEVRSGQPAEAKAAKRSIESKVKDIKKDQLRTNAPARHYPIEITADNRALLHLPGSAAPVDLGPIGAASTTFDLKTEIERLLRAFKGFKTLFVGPKGVKLAVAIFTVVHGGRRVVQLSLTP